jgi:hypothetical protein
MFINLNSIKFSIKIYLPTRVGISTTIQVTMLAIPARLTKYNDYNKFNKNTQNTLLIAKKMSKYSIIYDYFIFLSFN